MEWRGEQSQIVFTYKSGSAISNVFAIPEFYADHILGVKREHKIRLHNIPSAVLIIIIV
jgi:hypothetical protein